MNWCEVEQRWRDFAPTCQALWPKLKAEHLQAVAGKRERLAQILRELYCLSEEEAERAIVDFELDIRRPGAAK